MPRSIRLTLLAQTAELTEEGKRRWHITSVLEDKDRRALVLVEPLTEAEKEECRWYLEEYAQVSPFSVTRARAVEALLKRYSKSLMEQLQLIEQVNLLEHDLSSKPDEDALEIQILETTSAKLAGATVHEIYWELLEEPELWKPYNLRVVIKRITGESASNERPEVLNTETTTINVLLVVARDLRPDSKTSDISPSMVLNVLLDVQTRIRATGSAVRLTVEVVRPGTLEALEAHLRRRGLGYFHIVHFDLHGVFDSTQDVSYLLFNAREPDNLGIRPEKAQDVARIIRDFSIPAVVLNACESAKADVSADANIACVLRSEGKVRSVVAMSYSVSSTAAQVYMTGFYRHLFLQGGSVASAAQFGRSVLRGTPLRDARFGLRPSLSDYFVPVVYGSEDDVTIGRPRSEQPLKDIYDAVKEHLTMPPSSDFVGRDLDLLRLERKLHDCRILYMSGRIGVGKSTLLLKARTNWLRTSFFQCVLLVDVALLKPKFFVVILGQFLQQLPFPDARRRQIHQAMTDVLAIESKPLNMKELASSLFEPLAGLRTLVVFDGLHFSHTAGPQLIPELMGAEELNKLNEFMEYVVSLAKPSEHLHTIFCGRSEEPRFALQDALSIQLAEHPFNLPGLSTSDAMLMAQSLASAQGSLSRLENPKQDLDELEQAVCLLGCLPGAIREIFPLAVSECKSWSEVHDFVHQGVMKDYNALSTFDSFKYLERLTGRVRDQLCAFILMISTYWHEGPSVVPFMNSLAEFGLGKKVDDAEAEAAGTIVKILRDQDYLDLQELRITRIHPMFTIYCRSLAYKLYRDEAENSRARETSLLFRVKGWVSSYIFGSKSKSISASAVCMRISRTMATEITNVTNSYNVDNYVHHFMDSIGEDMLSGFMEDHLKGIDYEQICQRWNTLFENSLTCVLICLQSPSVPMEHWPLWLIQQLAANLRLVGTASQAAVYAKRLDRLIQLFLEEIGSSAVPEQYQLFALTVLNCLTAIYNNEFSIPEKYEEYINLTTEVVSASEAEFGAFTDYHIKKGKAMAMRYRTFRLLSKGLQEEAEALWESMLNYEKEIESVQSGDLGAPPSLDTVMGTIADRLTDDPEQKAEMQERLKAISDRKVPTAFYDSRQNSLQWIKAIGAARSQTEDQPSKEWKRTLAHLGYGLRNIHDAVETTGVFDLKEDRKWYPKNFDMIRSQRQASGSAQRLNAIEKAIQSGHLLGAVEHHGDLIGKAVRSGRLEDAVEHMSAIETIYQAHSALGSTLQDFQKRKNLATHALKGFEILKSGSESTAQDSLENLDRQIQLMEECNVPPEFLQVVKMSKDFLVKDVEEYGTGSASRSLHYSDDEAKKLHERMGKMFKRIRKPEDVQTFGRLAVQNQQFLKEIQDAEVARDLDAEEEALNRYEKFAQDPFAADIADPDWITRRRVELERRRFWKPYVERWQDVLIKRDWKTAHSIVDTLQADQPSRFASAFATEQFENMRAKTEEIQWTLELSAAEQALAKANFDVAFHGFKNLLDQHSQGAFTRIADELITDKVLDSLVTKQLGSLALACNTFDEAQRIAKIWLKANTEEEKDAEVVKRHREDFKTFCEIVRNMKGYEEAIMGEDTAGDALAFVMELHRLRGEMEGVERKWKLCGVLTAENYQKWVQRILVARMMVSNPFSSLLSGHGNEEEEEEEEDE